jgi:hypothetical protein
MARQIQELGGLHHFLRHAHTEEGLWRDPYGFLASIAFQLIAQFGRNLFPASVVVDVDQRIHVLEGSGSLAGIRVSRLYAVPWSETQLHVQQEVDQAGGVATGLEIGELVEEYHRIPLHIFREMALLAPLRRLRKEQPNVRVTLWVDGLDEDPSPELSIAATLPNPDEVAGIGNLWIVVASRPGPHLDRFIAAGATLIDAAEDRFAQDRRAFTEAYIGRALGDSKVQAAITKVRAQAEELAKSLLEQAGDNALYLAQFFKAVCAGELPALMKGELPKGLDAIHARLIGAVAVHHAAFRERLYPILEVLSVARQPLDQPLLARFCEIDEVAPALDTLAPFLDVHREGEGARAGYALYHRALRETLVSLAHRDETWHVDLPTAHDRMSGPYLRQLSSEPDAIDAYGLTFLAGHLAAGTPGSRLRLLDLPNARWWQMRRRAAGSLWPVLSDLTCAQEVARGLPVVQAIPAIARLTLLAGRIHDAELDMPSGLLRLAARLGQAQRALDNVSPEMTISDQVDHLCHIAAALSRNKDGSLPLPSLYWQIIQHALALLRRDPDGFQIATLMRTCPTEAASDIVSILVEASQLAQSLPPDYRRPRALIEVARLQFKNDRKVGIRWFRTALADCHQCLRSSLTLEQERLVRYWVTLDPTVAGSSCRSCVFGRMLIRYTQF